jgi:mono/diheme cytochrome c family protein
MARLFRWIIFLSFIGGIVFWWISRPQFIDPSTIADLSGDADRGGIVFYAGGCSSCHAEPKATGDAKLVLSGGLEFHTQFGTFVAPNISPSDEGIGSWSAADLANAMLHGVSPDGAHYYPAFPYTSYSKASLQDIVDLKAFIDTLPPSDVANIPHDVGFPFNIRRTLGGWKFLFASDAFVQNDIGPELDRGRYLVEALGHCAECHTPRNILGGLKNSAWMSGGPNPNGRGNIPNITPHETGIGSWSRDEIVEYLTSGFTPEFNVAGGGMADVVLNTGQLSVEDRGAIADYLMSLPALEKSY